MLVRRLYSVQKWIASPSTASAASFTHFAERRVRGDGPSELARRRLERHAQRCLGEHLRRHRPDDVDAERLAGLARPRRSSPGRPSCSSPSRGRWRGRGTSRSSPRTPLARLLLGQADAGDLRLAVRGARHAARSSSAGDSCPASRSTTITPIAEATCAMFMHAGDVADGVDAVGAVSAGRRRPSRSRARPATPILSRPRPRHSPRSRCRSAPCRRRAAAPCPSP